jgi:hypothetical protein
VGYNTSIDVPKRTKLRPDAHYDNSANNPNNPDPSRTVRPNNQNWEEMYTVVIGVVVDKDVPVKSILDLGKITFDGA